MSTQILFVDDEPNILEAYRRNLRLRFRLDTASSGQEGLKLLADRGPYAVIVADMQMPVMNGIEFLAQARQRCPDSVRIMLTGNADQKTAVEAVNQGHVYQFLNKPCLPEHLTLALNNAIHQYQLITAERELLEKTLNGCINMLMGILSSAEPQAFGRGERLREQIRAYARFLNLRDTWELELAAMLSQIGYVSVPPQVLEKVRAGLTLTLAEQSVLDRVPEVGAKLLTNIPRLGSVAKTILYQAKNYDGSGFPADSIAAEAIPISSRILRVLADLADLEAAGLTRPRALEQMQTRQGLYDPQVLDSTFACFDVYLTVPSSTKGGSRAVSLEQLAVGQTLTANIETVDGLLLARPGTRISPLILEKLRNFQELQGVKQPLHVETDV